MSSNIAMLIIRHNACLDICDETLYQQVLQLYQKKTVQVPIKCKPSKDSQSLRMLLDG